MLENVKELVLYNYHCPNPVNLLWNLSDTGTKIGREKKVKEPGLVEGGKYRNEG